MAKSIAPLVTRRRFLVATGATVVGAPLLLRFWSSASDAQLFVSANDDLAGGHFVSGFDSTLRRRFATPVDVRCHGIVLDPGNHERAIVLARRPGTTAYDLDLSTGAIQRTIRSPADRHFYGHGCVSSDGKTFFASENDFDHQRGVIGIYDARDLSRQGEIPSHGVGPHEIRLMADGKTIVVANGGLLTHPDTGRRKLNVPTMDPSLAYVDSQSGALLGIYRTPDHLAGIRHISVSDQGLVAIAMQHEGKKDAPRPVVAFHDGGEMRLGEASVDENGAMAGYVSSVCLDPKRGRAGFTCPRGGRVSFFDGASGAFVRSHEIRDAGGITLAAGGEEFLVTTGFGEIHRIDAETLERVGEPRRIVGSRWDNHVVGV